MLDDQSAKSKRPDWRSGSVLQVCDDRSADRQYDVYNYIFLMRSISISRLFPQGLTH